VCKARATDMVGPAKKCLSPIVDFRRTERRCAVAAACYQNASVAQLGSV